MAKSQKKGGSAPASRTARRRQTSEPTQQTKKQIALGRKQARQNRIIWLSVAGLALILLAIVAIGVTRELVVAPASPVATVNGAKIRASDYQALLDYRRYTLHANRRDLENALQSVDPNQEGNDFLISFYQQQLDQVSVALSGVSETTLDELIDDQLIKARTVELGITVSDAEVEQTIGDDIRQAIAPPVQEPVTGTNAVATPLPVSQDEVDQYYQAVLDNMQLRDKEFRTIVQRSLLASKLQDYLAAEVPTTGLVLTARLIQADAEEAAAAAIERLAAGETFADVATEVSTDPQTAEAGGEVGTVTPDQLASRYGDAVSSLATLSPVGTVQQVESDGAFYVIQVAERDENGPLPEEVLTQRQSSALIDWLDERRVAPDVQIERLLEPDQIPPDPFANF